MASQHDLLASAVLRLARWLPGSVRHFLAHGRLTRPVTRRLYDVLVGGADDEIIALAAPLDGFRMRLDTRAFKAYVLGTHEPVVSKNVQEHVGSGDYVVDVGAHLGYFTLLLAKQAGKEGKVWAFELAPEICATLRENVEMNDLSGRIEVENMAVGERDGALNVHRVVGSRWNAGAFSLIGGTRFPQDGGTGTGVSLDGYFLPKALPHLDFLKIDVEGAEGLVLNGARQILSRHRPTVLVEMHTFAGSTYEAATAALLSSGYRLAVVDREYDFAYHVLGTPA